MKETKKKVSFDFTTTSVESIERKKEGIKASNKSEAMNILIDTFCNVPADVTCSICSFLLDSIHRMMKNGLVGENNLFSIQIYNENLLSYQKMLYFFSDSGRLLDLPNNGLIRVEINGGYVIYPQHWKLYSFGENCSYAGVISISNNNISPILVLLEKPVNTLNFSDSNSIFTEIGKDNDEFQKILDERVEPVYNSAGKIQNGDEYLNSSKPGIFEIPDYGSPAAVNALGAMIIRD